MFSLRLALLFALGLSLSPLAPSRAEAQGEGATAIVLFGSPGVGIAGTVFLVADLVYAGEGQPLTTEWSVAQLVCGVLELALGATSLIGIAQGSVLSTQLGGFAAAGLGAGLGHLIHAVWSLTSPLEPTVDVQVSWLEGGGMLSVRGLLSTPREGTSPYVTLTNEGPRAHR